MSRFLMFDMDKFKSASNESEAYVLGFTAGELVGAAREKALHEAETKNKEKLMKEQSDKIKDNQQSVSRDLVMEAALLYVSRLGLPHDVYLVLENGLRLGFAIGTRPDPESLVAKTALDAAAEAAAQAMEFRKQEAARMAQADIIQPMMPPGVQGGLSGVVGLGRRQRLW